MAKTKTSKAPVATTGPPGPVDLTAVATVARLAERFRLAPEVIEGFGVADRKDGRGVDITYRDAAGLALFKRRRTKVGANGNTYQARGQPLRPYGLWRQHLQASSGFVLLVEGESDCWVAWEYNIPALGIPGSTNVGCLRSDDILPTVERVYVVLEPDEAGEGFVADLRLAMALQHPDLPVIPLSFDPHKDLADWHASVGPALFPAEWRAGLRSARPLPSRKGAASQPPEGPSPSEGVRHPGMAPTAARRPGGARRAQPAAPVVPPHLSTGAAGRAQPAEGAGIPSEGEGPSGGNTSAAPSPDAPRPGPFAPSPLPPPTPRPSTNGDHAPRRPPADPPADPPGFAPGNSRRPVGRVLSEVAPEDVEWVAAPWMAAGVLHMVAGRGGTGKSTFLAYLAGLAGRSVLMMGAAPEESLGAMTGPRMVANGVDLSTVFVVEGPSITLPERRDQLAQVVKDHRARAVFLDPVDAYLGEGGESDPRCVLGLLDSLVWVADRTGAAIVCIRHPGKDPSNLLPGSRWWRNKPRIVLEMLLDPGPPERRLIWHDKDSFGLGCPARWYSLDAQPGRPPRWTWGPPADKVALDLARNVTDRIARWKIDQCEELIEAIVKEGRVDMSVVVGAAERERLMEDGGRLLRRAAERLEQCGKLYRKRFGSGRDHRMEWSAEPFPEES